MLVRSLIVALLFTLGLSLGPAAPALAADCTARGAGVDLQSCNLSGLDLSGATLTGANLQGANLRDTNLNGARLAGANLAYADLRGATFAGTNLRGATLTGARVYPDTLSGANTRGATGSVIVVARPVVVNPVVTVTYIYAGTLPSGGTINCSANVQLSNFQPTTTYTAKFTIDGSYIPSFDETVTTDGNGAALLSLTFADLRVGTEFGVDVDGVSSGTSTAACSAP